MLENIRANYGPIRVAIVDTDCHHGMARRTSIGTTPTPSLFPFTRTQNLISGNWLSG